jgi:hypothetical protein
MREALIGAAVGALTVGFVNSVTLGARMVRVEVIVKALAAKAGLEV